MSVITLTLVEKPGAQMTEKLAPWPLEGRVLTLQAPVGFGANNNNN